MKEEDSLKGSELDELRRKTSELSVGANHDERHRNSP